MLSHAAKELGYGWGFGVHEALDQGGALFGPLLVAAILSHRGAYRLAYETLLIPALLTLSFLLVARFIYPRPADFEPAVDGTTPRSSFSRTFWLYLAGAALVAAGFADFALIAFHFKNSGTVPGTWIPIFYSVAMAVSGLGSLLFGRLFDCQGIRVLLPLTVITAISAPLVFLGHFMVALVGAALWGLGMGVQESIIPAAVATIAPASRRPTAYGLFTGVYGVAWFLGSVAIGLLYEVSSRAVVIFCVLTQLAAVPLFRFVKNQNATREENETYQV
jgi:predicted MFS family arabinose efflux permease